MVSAALLLAVLTPAPAAAEPRVVEVTVEKGYQPASIEAAEGERLRLRIVRKEYTPCTKEIVFPALNLKRELPVNKPVIIDLPALEAGELEFHCGMKMVRGAIKVEPKR